MISTTPWSAPSWILISGIKFGFTEDEVKELLEYFGYGSLFPGVKEWYNGYIFGEAHDIYNPWSILKFTHSRGRQFRPFWLNTSDNQHIKDILQIDKRKSKETVEALLSGDLVTASITENVIYSDIKHTPEAGLNFLLHCGYLKAHDPVFRRNHTYYKLEIPNREIETIYYTMLEQWFEEDQPINQDLEELIQALKECNWPLFEEALSRILLKTVSYYDLNAIRKDILPDEKEKAAKENFYHGLMLGLMVQLTEEYRVESNREYGEGRPGLVASGACCSPMHPNMIILPADKEESAFVFEFKYLKKKDKGEPDAAAENALAQIKEKKYAEGLKAAGYSRVTAIGIGFKGKEVKIKY